jgi:hypothetical protein
VVSHDWISRRRGIDGVQRALRQHHVAVVRRRILGYEGLVPGRPRVLRARAEASVRCSDVWKVERRCEDAGVDSRVRVSCSVHARISMRNSDVQRANGVE